MPKKSIVWLASYPKSGNTWTRIFLANYLLNRQTPMPINQVHQLGMGDAVARTYTLVARLPVDTTDPAETLKLRPAVLRGIVANNADVNLVKTHNIRSFAMGTELIPAPMTRAAVYILRNPLDVVLSYQRHFGGTLEQTVELFGRSDHAVSGDASNVPQFLGSWSEHVRSWTEKPRFPTLVLRYEDLQSDPAPAFRRLVELLGMPVDEERLARAIRFSSFDEVSRQESEKSFVEKSPHAERFFHSGTSGQWEEALPPDLADRIRRDHRKTMKAHGYL